MGSTQITYDAFGRAVVENKNGTATNIVYSPTGQKFAFMSGSTVGQYFVPMPAGMQAVFNGNGLQYFRHADWLGSSRFASNAANGSIYYDSAYAPFGENYAEMGTADRSFTGQTQDTVSGLYDFLSRQQSSAQGRWLVPDPGGLAAVDITNPQTWNRYAYVANNPSSNIDPLGLDLFDEESDACSDASGDLCPGSGPGGGGGGGQSTSSGTTSFCDPSTDPNSCGVTAGYIFQVNPYGNNPPGNPPGNPSDNPNLSTPSQYNGNVGNPGYTNYITVSFNQSGTQIPLNRTDRPDDLLSPTAQKILAQVGQTAPQVIHPCSILGFYALSAGGATYASLLSSGSLFPEIFSSTAGPVGAIASRTMPYVRRGQQAVGRATAFIMGGAVSFCNSF